MRRFLKWLLLFFLPLLIIEILFEIFIRIIPNNYKQKYQWMQENCQDVEILALGSSYMNNAICPYKFEKKCYNLSMPAQTLEYDYKILSQFINNMPRLKHVIISADHYNLTSKPLAETKSSAYRATYYQLYMNIKTYSALSPNSYEIFKTHMAKMKAIKYLLSFFNDNNQSDNDSLGWKLSIGKKDKKDGWADVRFEEIMNYFSLDNDTAYINYNLLYLRKISELCRSNNVNLIVVTTPKSSYFTTRFPCFVMDKVLAAVKECERSCNFLYKNYYNDNRFCDDDFITTDHLDDVGGVKFTQILLDDFHYVGL